MPEHFLGLLWEKLSLQHRERLEPSQQRNPHCLSGYTVASLAAWDSSFNYFVGFPEPETLLFNYLPTPAHRKCDRRRSAPARSGEARGQRRRLRLSTCRGDDAEGAAKPGERQSEPAKGVAEAL